MSIAASSIEKHVKAFCTQIGADSLLVQGAGGNVSWKDGDTLWIKASGIWLAEAELKEIFVPVNFSLLQAAFSRHDFSVNPQVIDRSDLRPSIETALHALMPHRIVVHLHAVEILVYLVQKNAKQKIQTFVGDAVKWVFVDYFKPGADLARAVFEQLTNKSDADVIFLGNHGVVIGGNDLEDIIATLRTLTSRLQTTFSPLLTESTLSTRKSDFFTRGYTLCHDKEIGFLVHTAWLVNKLRHEWALYPDHVVFLGAMPAILEENFMIPDLDELVKNRPPFIFSINDGIYVSPNVTAAQKAQLRCYYDVIIRQDHAEKLSTLSDQQVSELLDWDAERYRQNLTKNK
jgi:rhamnose utilization protein RhaD (predicted bifunctional aldolase and dehydrogenase)